MSYRLQLLPKADGLPVPFQQDFAFKFLLFMLSTTSYIQKWKYHVLLKYHHDAK